MTKNERVKKELSVMNDKGMSLRRVLKNKKKNE